MLFAVLRAVCTTSLTSWSPLLLSDELLCLSLHCFIVSPQPHLQISPDLKCEHYLKLKLAALWLWSAGPRLIPLLSRPGGKAMNSFRTQRGKGANSFFFCPLSFYLLGFSHVSFSFLTVLSVKAHTPKLKQAVFQLIKSLGPYLQKKNITPQNRNQSSKNELSNE